MIKLFVQAVEAIATFLLEVKVHQSHQAAIIANIRASVGYHPTNEMLHLDLVIFLFHRLKAVVIEFSCVACHAIVNFQHTFFFDLRILDFVWVDVGLFRLGLWIAAAHLLLQIVTARCWRSRCWRWRWIAAAKLVQISRWHFAALMRMFQQGWLPCFRERLHQGLCWLTMDFLPMGSFCGFAISRLCCDTVEQREQAQACTSRCRHDP
mmetsp:Transcript_1741/g.3135  ORF Transcript_1741/g.3135 Transcript_1741/m.3135 type:complete len:208 (+) Transcript_1741:69-692(+)